MSAFIRKMVLNGYMIIPEWPELKGVLSLHSRISNNLNQYAKKANETGKLYEEDIAEIKKMHNQQTEFLKKALECKLRSNGMPVPLLRNGYSIFNGTKYR